MWWQLIIECPNKSFDNYCSQTLAFRWVVYRLTYRSTMCYPNYTALSFVAISILMIYLFDVFAFSLEFVSLLKIYNSMLLLLLNICKLSYFIKYLNLTCCTSEWRALLVIFLYYYVHAMNNSSTTLKFCPWEYQLCLLNNASGGCLDVIHFPLYGYVAHSSSMFSINGTCFIDYFIDDWPLM
jgi:hypothetical protein